MYFDILYINTQTLKIVSLSTSLCNYKILLFISDDNLCSEVYLLITVTPDFF